MKKINTIVNISSFQYFDWEKVNPENDPVFKKVNILFGENGSGKSSIVDIFKSMHNDDDNLPKNWDFPNKDREIEVELKISNKITFDENNHWSNNTLIDKFVIFDKEFIDRYVHSGLSTVVRTHEHDKQTGQLVLYLGDFYGYKVQLDKFRNLKSIISEKNKYLKDEIDSFILDLQLEEKGYRFEEDVLPIILDQVGHTEDERSELIRTLSKDENKSLNELESINKVISKKKDILDLEKLNEIENIDDINNDEVLSSLKFSLGKGALEVLVKIKNRESFVKTGLDEINKENLEKCPFCNQSIILESGEFIPIINEYVNIFNEEFSERQASVIDLLNVYKEILSSLLKMKNLDSNDKSLAQINALLSKDFSLTKLSLKKSEIELIEKELENVNKKLDDVLTKCDIERLQEIIEVNNSYKENIAKHNKIVVTINNYLGEQIANIKTGKLVEDQIALTDKLTQIQKKKYILENYHSLRKVKLELDAHEKNLNFCASLDILVDDYRDQIQTEFKSFVNKYYKKINKYIQLLSPTLEIFKIETKKLNYDLRSNDIVCGFEVIYKDKDRFIELSEGEKQIIASAFFFSFIEEEKDKKQKYLIFDDPITNFDAGRRRQTAEIIYKHTHNFNQSFIFTCDPLFRYYLMKVTDGNKRSLFNILKSASSCIHCVFKNKSNIYGTFKTRLKNISNEKGTEENIIIYGQMLRYCVEEIKEKYLGYGEENFSQILDIVNKRDFDKLKSNLEVIKQIYSFATQED